MRRHRWIYVPVLLLIAVCTFVIVGLAKQKTPAVPFSFAGFTNSIDRQTIAALSASSISNWIELHYPAQMPEKMFNGQHFPPSFRRIQGFGMGGNELFDNGQWKWGSVYTEAEPFWRMEFGVPASLPKVPWRLLLQINGDLPGQTNRFGAFVRNIGQKCGFNMANAEWLDTKVWVDIPGRP